MISRKFQYSFRREEVGDLDPKMYMKKPSDGGADVRAPVVMGRGRDRYVRVRGDIIAEGDGQNEGRPGE